MTNVAFILGPSAVASGRPPGTLGVTPVAAGAAAPALPETPAFAGALFHPFPAPFRRSFVDGNRWVEEEEMK